MLVFIVHSIFPDKTHLLNWPILSLLIIRHHLPSPYGWIQPAELPVPELVRVSVRQIAIADLYSRMMLLVCLNVLEAVSRSHWCEAEQGKEELPAVRCTVCRSPASLSSSTAQLKFKVTGKKPNHHDSSLRRQTKPILLW